MEESIRLYSIDILGRVALHGEGPHDPGYWNLDPGILMAITLVLAFYLYAVVLQGRIRPPYRLAEGADPAKLMAFLAGLLVFFLAVASPLDVLSDEYLFSAHMVQHILIASIVPPLLLLGIPGQLVSFRGSTHLLTHPAFAFLIFNLNFALWHLPSLYELALANQHVHVFQHLTFLATGTLNWWPVLSPLRQLPRLSPPLQLLYLFANSQPGTALGAVFVFSRHVIYQAYGEAPRLFDISALTDQQLGGLIMWIPGNAVYLIALSIVFLNWVNAGAGQKSFR